MADYEYLKRVLGDAYVPPPEEEGTPKEPDIYTPDQRRVCDYLQKITNCEIGCGDDPIGFLIASHAAMVEINRERTKADSAVKLILSPKGAVIAMVDDSEKLTITLHYDNAYQAATAYNESIYAWRRFDREKGILIHIMPTDK